MDIILIILTVGALNVVCFLIGAKIGQTVAKGDTVELPSVDPIKAIRERKDRKTARQKQDRLDTIMRNIERYDGTPQGQEEVPGG